MRKKSNDAGIKIKVIEDASDHKRRRITIELEAPAQSFELVDILTKYAGFLSLSTFLKAETEQLIHAYLSSGLSAVKPSSSAPNSENQTSN